MFKTFLLANVAKHSLLRMFQTFYGLGVESQGKCERNQEGKTWRGSALRGSRHRQSARSPTYRRLATACLPNSSAARSRGSTRWRLYRLSNLVLPPTRRAKGFGETASLLH